MLSSHRLKQEISYHYDLFIPATGPAPLLICLHGYGQNKEIAMQFGRQIRSDWPIAVLQAPHPHHRNARPGQETGFGWVSAYKPQEDIDNHHRFISQVIQEAFSKGITDKPAAFLFGFSQSVSLNYRFAAAQPQNLRGVIAVAGAAPSDWLTGSSTPALKPPILHISTSEDNYYPAKVAQLFKQKLTARASDLSWHDAKGGHRVPKSAYPLIKQWLDARV